MLAHDSMQAWITKGASMADHKDASKVKGGNARARALSPEKRQEIARTAASAR
jgi:hypothetical protein